MKPAPEGQTTLAEFQARLLSRRQDPSSSKAAARALVRSGKLNRQQEETLTAVRAKPGSTAWELADGNATLRYKYSRRLPELLAKNKVFHGIVRVCRIAKTRQWTWEPVEP